MTETGALRQGKSCQCKTTMGLSDDLNPTSGGRASLIGRHKPDPLTPPKIFLSHIPTGWRGTQKTVEQIQALIRAGAKDFYVRQKAIDIVLEKEVKPKDYLGEIKALFEWVQKHVRYTKDTFQVEVLHSAKRMLELRAGDCDDMTILLGALLEAIGHPVRLVLSGLDQLRQDFFTHIYLEVFHMGRWIPLDPTMQHPMGWEPRTPVKKTIAIERRSDKMAEELELRGIEGGAVVPDWLRGLLRAVRREAIQPKDTRIKSLWDLLRQRQLLRKNPWLKAALHRIWNKGLSARPRPRTAHRIRRSLRLWGILPPKVASATAHRQAVRHPLTQVAVKSVRPVALRPVASLRPTAMQAVRPVQMQPVLPKAARR